MKSPLPRRLVLAFRHDDPVESAPATDPTIEFIGYAEDSVLSGRLEMTADRLSDLLNSHDEYVLTDVRVSELATTRGHDLVDLAITRDELMLVHATGPRGDAQRRTRTVRHPILVKAGPYHVEGFLHALPGSDPLGSLKRRRPFVALTDASVEFVGSHGHEHRTVETLLINREQVDWIKSVVDDEIELPELPKPTQIAFSKPVIGGDGVDVGNAA